MQQSSDDEPIEETAETSAEPAVVDEPDEVAVDEVAIDEVAVDEGSTALSDLPSLDPTGDVPPVRRTRRNRVKVSTAPATGPSLTSPLLTGRSLESHRPKRRFAVLRDHPRWATAGVIVVAVVAGLVLGKVFAERSADSAMTERVEELRELLDGATPEEFLAFNAGVQEPGSLAVRTRDLDGFVNVTATAEQSFIRFQPSGWWAGFTERCLVAVVREDAVTITVPKTACIRVEAPPS